MRGLVLLVLQFAALAATAADDGPYSEADGKGIHEWDGQVQWDDEVAVLNGRNFDEAIERNDHVLVEFFAPWCGHCTKFEPVYRKAASHLRLEVSFAEEVFLR